ncbi:hypothetical protein COY13_04500 [Candidatus Roizmanbacteria bacterium CG_4_10_14_0_2_um_filter_36_35]|uniref:Bacterial spore germination immunoglobulin-like domain-containing protein n=5 Tax=Candidatus Roizmaniibacteriota TaxID=1752723 RepID=A0A2M7BX45_9BACT|nr:MAG: hypothetical protein COV86_00515 [Candidatus Roizmanbacteria bacterium CG11_big_fil_rev_8_21_14_0_20_35_14]PIV11132.1 MAG: hypothetical protein COS50_01870 [Candidatus Roizmanbacteria bacterium CG03_land_8_20_14_0_80_35_26]PIZ66916.1 MAG: hypothetical protein COY13_04500 [Candidatus Roizmanbacteria bacterium CG_4_10_14_0_2_um_filter_36_35]PJC33542.1 MAG: hypothetical protein CO049_00395 [Candidatus Roizmanbacteria bacterium CG_4_9_14_0_2_um_filter_36_12]PJC81803.1 MAG: hypothetical prot
MKKETIIAVFLGIAFGGILAFFLIVKNKEIQLNKNKVIAPTGANTQSAVKTNISVTTLEVTEPNDGSIFDKNSVTIKGKVSKDSLIVLQSPIKDLVFKNEKEDFSIDFPLALGENVIKLVVYPSDKQSRTQEKDLKIYYLREEL